LEENFNDSAQRNKVKDYFPKVREDKLVSENKIKRAVKRERGIFHKRSSSH